MHLQTITVLCIAVIGCEDKPKSKPPPPAPDVDGIAIVADGAEPRAPLRYRLAKSDPTPLELAMDLDLHTADREAVLPTLVIGVDVAVVDVDPAGSATVKMSVVSAGARPRGPGADPANDEAVRLMDRQSALLVGLATSFKLSPRGVASESKVDGAGRDLSGPMTEQVATLLQVGDRLSMQLPDKPLGIGAVWKHRKTIEQNQLTLITNTTVEITAIEDALVSFKSTTQLSGADQTIMQGSATAKVTKIRGSGSATGKLDLARAILLGETRATLELDIVVDGQARATKLATVTRYGPRAPPPAHEPTDADDLDAGAPAHDDDDDHHH